MSKQLEVKYRKLGREKADGQALSKSFGPFDGVIELDERLKGKNLFGALLHETLHHALPTTHENEILRIEKEMVPTLWRELKKNPEKYK